MMLNRSKPFELVSKSDAAVFLRSHVIITYVPNLPRIPRNKFLLSLRGHGRRASLRADAIFGRTAAQLPASSAVVLFRSSLSLFYLIER
jgi:hypothetical protein